ncbi:MAG: hypothetical protein M3Y17_06895 [Actinomycetota bacterium]|nr:hypothetical protein [Actinomycetota bacterium]
MSREVGLGRGACFGCGVRTTILDADGRSRLLTLLSRRAGVGRRWAIRTAAWAIVVFALGATVPPAVGATIKQASVISAVDLPVRIGGQLTVGFHGDPATGCASHGLCGYGGIVTWRPPRSGTLEIVAYRAGRKVMHEASLELLNQQPNGGVTTSVVQRAIGSGPTGQCEDSRHTGNALLLSIRAKSLFFTFARAIPALLATRCAGPLDADALRTLRPGHLALRAALPGSTAVDLSATGQFAASGFAGTTRSTLTLKLGKPHRARAGNHSPLSRVRYPEVDVSYRASLAGEVVERFHETGGLEVCHAVDACGARGTIKLIPLATASHAVISAIGPANRPFTDLLAALGLSHHGHVKRVQVSGSIRFTQHGRTQAAIKQGSQICTDSVPVDAGEGLVMQATTGRLFAIYATGVALGADPLRTRCPGPEPKTHLFGVALAEGRFPRTGLAQRTITIHLNRGFRYLDHGYTTRVAPRLTLTLTRQRIARHLVRVPTDATP